MAYIWSMIPFFVGMVSCLGVFFRSRYKLGLEILAVATRNSVLTETVAVTGSAY